MSTLFLLPCQNQPAEGHLSFLKTVKPSLRCASRVEHPKWGTWHVARTHRVDLDFLFERLRGDFGIYIKYVGTKEQIADIFTKGSFTAEAWMKLCKLAQIGKSSTLLESSALHCSALLTFSKCPFELIPEHKRTLGQKLFMSWILRHIMCARTLRGSSFKLSYQELSKHSRKRTLLPVKSISSTTINHLRSKCIWQFAYNSRAPMVKSIVFLRSTLEASMSIIRVILIKQVSSLMQSEVPLKILEATKHKKA